MFQLLGDNSPPRNQVFNQLAIEAKTEMAEKEAAQAGGVAREKGVGWAGWIH